MSSPIHRSFPDSRWIDDGEHPRIPEDEDEPAEWNEVNPDIELYQGDDSERPRGADGSPGSHGVGESGASPGRAASGAQRT